MTLRQRTLAFIGVTIISLTLVLLYTANQILFTGFEVLERRDVQENLERAQNVFNGELTNLDAFAQDWSFWDDTYEFIGNQNEQYITKNWDQSTFTSERINAVMLLDANGKLVYRQGFDLETKKMTALPDELTAQTDKLIIKAADGKISGVVMLTKGPMLIVARPVLNSAKNMPVVGTVIVGRYLNDAKLSELADVAQLNITLASFGDEALPADFQTARMRLSESGEQIIVPLSGDTIAGYWLVKDIEQKPALLVKIAMPRYIYWQGQRTMGYLIGALLIFGIVLGMTYVIVLKRTVLDRLAKLSNSVIAIGKSGAPTAKVEENGSDELSYLAQSINSMLRSLEMAERELRTSEAINRMLLEKIPDSILLLNRQGTVLDFKTGKYRCAAIPSLLFPGKNLTDIYPPEFARRFKEHIEAAITTKSQQVFKQQSAGDQHTICQEIRIDVSGENEVIAIIRDFIKPKND